MDEQVLDAGQQAAAAAADVIAQDVITQDVVDNVFAFLSSLQVELIIMIALLALVLGLQFALILFMRWTA